jgi:hypothetical protein
MEWQARLQAVMARQDISEREVAQAVGTSPSSVQRFLQGQEGSLATRTEDSLKTWIVAQEGEPHPEPEPEPHPVPDDPDGPAEEDDEEEKEQAHELWAYGSGQAVARLRQHLCLAEAEEITLEKVLDVIVDLKTGQDEMLHRMTKAAVSRQGATAHTIDQCAEALLGCCMPEVLEHIELAMQATQRPPWAIIASAVNMWRRDLVGGDFTEVREPGQAMAVGQQPWSAPSLVKPGQPLAANLAICETCDTPFPTPANHFKPRFGCASCAEAGDKTGLDQKNRLAWQRAQENPESKPTYQPDPKRPVKTLDDLPTKAERLHHAIYVKGCGPCTCGQVVESVA